jgi:hypothetical protein
MDNLRRLLKRSWEKWNDAIDRVVDRAGAFELHEVRIKTKGRSRRALRGRFVPVASPGIARPQHPGVRLLKLTFTRRVIHPNLRF